VLTSDRRDLVPVLALRRRDSRTGACARPSAAFLAHLIAVAGKAPQTCERRRIEPGEAARCYDANSHRPASKSGRAMSWAM
jgi:hypothetical protein